MKQLIYISILISVCSALPALAVTDKEMEQARTIAAHVYLRYANDGSGYLDETHPTTMAELERVLKPKERENLKAFKAIAVPKDYASWDKAKLVDYWGNTAFASKGLLEKGKVGKSRAKKRLNAMSVASPLPAAEGKAGQAPAKEGQVQVSDKKVETSAATTPKPEDVSSTQQTAADSTAIAMSEAEAAATAALDDDLDEEIPKAKDNTWIYIVLLCILVGVVVALVVFASNVMKKNGAETPARRREDDTMAIPQGADAETLREKYAASLNAKNNEIHSLNKKVEDLTNQNQTLKANLEALTAETASLRTRLTEATRRLAAVSAAASSAPAAPKPSAAPSTQPHGTIQAAGPATPAATPQPQPKPAQPQATSLRTIFLGRANAKGIFVRADRTLNIGNTIYRLDTTDGYAGTFRVANDPTVWEMALLTPRESLSGACVCADFDDTQGKERIVNDSAGTAIFEGGCWKVIRKAKIHYE